LCFLWGKKLLSILEGPVYQLIVNTSARNSYWNDVLLVPLWIAIVNQGGEWEEQVERKLEYFKIRTSHLSLPDYLGLFIVVPGGEVLARNLDSFLFDMVGGPLGITLAPYIYRKPALLKALTPFAQAYINWSGYRKVGLRYDDLRKHTPLTENIVLIAHTASFILQSLKSVQTFRGCVISPW
jgi:hypothetical protein